MNKTVFYVAILVIVTLTAGVIVGMGIGRLGSYRADYPQFRSKMPLSERPEKFRGAREERAGILEKLTQRLNLSEEQEVKIKNILEASREEVTQARKSSLEKLVAIKEKTNMKIREALTAKQQAEFDKMISELKERSKTRKQMPRPPQEEEHRYPPERESRPELN